MPWRISFDAFSFLELHPQDLDNLKGLSITTSQLQAGMVTHVVWQIANPQAGRPCCGVWFDHDKRWLAGGVNYFSISILRRINQYVFGMG